MSLPLCPVCGGTGELHEAPLAMYPNATIPIAECPRIATGECVAVRLPIGVYLGPGGNPQTGYLDAAKVVPWCETHRSTVTERHIGGKGSSGRLMCLVRFIDPTAIDDPCHVGAAVVTTIGEYA